MAKPRMTRADKFKQRTVVLRYRAYKDELRLRRVKVPEGATHITFVLPMPASWSKKKRETMLGTPHQQRPDVDNLHKGLLDAVFKEDCQVWDHRITKVWGVQGMIRVEPIENENAA
ncbi:RusA family crossover junction endodeoxyribonuclease [Marinobacter sp. BGYM27]|uniref:RusA family crossover junction endodeoxyribonuclease n=1 Tax=Marinobacter sp. BGYM27 TaxID=2975597 RepID=UPI0021A29258|nr:RusA family crossover junction endodeoxyribonuclease [Marinobacter sp. BGYM27]MDG5498947.1 RusA family crossover junction endodeoxyribonuclease [Marinobacter sp. BGYM27]